jgi:hypothetical protein
MTRCVTAAALSPRRHPTVVVIIIAIARRPQRLDAFRRAVQAKFDRDCVRARKVRIVRVDEEPRGLIGFAAGSAHSGWGVACGGGEGYGLVVCAVARRGDGNEGLGRERGRDVLLVGWAVVVGLLVVLDDELTRC